MQTVNALTIDLEDWFHVTAFADLVPMNEWDNQKLRVEESNGRILDLLDRHGVKATFFVLGWLAERRPDLVRAVAERGHEIGVHSYWHRLVYDLDKESFRDDLRKATKAVEDACGVRATMYRAPTFSVVERSLWALDVLIEEGYSIDSSIFPVRHDRYGMPGFDRYPVRVERDGGSILEFPMTSWRIFGLNLPSAGGGYLRHFPQAWIRAGIEQANRSGEPAVIYIHPWELDPDQPRMDVGWLKRMRHYGGIEHTEARLDQLMGRYAFGTMSESLGDRV